MDPSRFDDLARSAGAARAPRRAREHPRTRQRGASGGGCSVSCNEGEVYRDVDTSVTATCGLALRQRSAIRHWRREQE